MSLTVRSRFVPVIAAMIVTALAVTGLQAAFADDTGDVVPADVYARTRIVTCEVGSGPCAFHHVRINCRTGDEVIGGAGWMISPTDRVVNLAAGGFVDRPNKKVGWQITHPEDMLVEGATLKVRVYCANTG